MDGRDGVRKKLREFSRVDLVKEKKNETEYSKNRCVCLCFPFIGVSPPYFCDLAFTQFNHIYIRVLQHFYTWHPFVLFLIVFLYLVFL